MRKVITAIEMLNLNENGMAKFTISTVEEVTIHFMRYSMRPKLRDEF